MKILIRTFTAIGIICMTSIFVLGQNESIGLNLSQMHADIFTLEWRRVITKTTTDGDLSQMSFGASNSTPHMFDGKPRYIHFRNLADASSLEKSAHVPLSYSTLLPPEKSGFKSGFLIGCIVGGVIGFVGGRKLGENIADGSNHALDAVLPFGFGLVGGVGGALLGGVIGGSISYSF